MSSGGAWGEIVGAALRDYTFIRYLPPGDRSYVALEWGAHVGTPLPIYPWRLTFEISGLSDTIR